MKRAMKISSLLLVLILTVLLGACGAADDTGTAPAATKAAGGGAAPAATDKAADGALMPTAPGELPIVPEGSNVTLTLTAMQTPFIADYESNYFVNWLEEQSGVNLEFIVLPADTILEKTLLTLSTSDTANLPDIYLSRGMAAGPDTIFHPSYASRWYDEGMIIPLNNLIDEHGFFIQKALANAQEYGYSIKDWITSADGNIYTLPTFSASLTISYPHKLWINQGWLDKLELPMPTTTQEFRDTLLAFKTQDPNGNNEADEIAFAGAKQSTYYGYDPVISAFTYNSNAIDSRMAVEDGTVVFSPIKDEWRDALIYMRELHDDGLYYGGSFTQDVTSIQQMATNSNDILGCFEGLGYDLVVVTDDQEVVDRYNSVPALIGPEGKHYATWRAPSAGASGTITSKCEYPEIAFRLLDLMMSDDGSKITRYGEKGVNWDDADEGTTGYYGTPAMMKILENTWAQPGQNQNFLQQSTFILDPAVAKGMQWSGDVKEPGYIKALSVMKLDETGIVPDEYLANLVYTLDEIEKINGPKTDIDSYIQQSIANFIAGDWDPRDDGQWATYIAEYTKMGLTEYQEIVQTCYTRMKGD